jgi:DNA polymerase-1
LRIVAKVAGENKMLEAYRKGEDLHVRTARSITGREEITMEDRQLAKAVNFGLLYGRRPRGSCMARRPRGSGTTPATATGRR